MSMASIAYATAVHATTADAINGRDVQLRMTATETRIFCDLQLLPAETMTPSFGDRSTAVLNTSQLLGLLDRLARFSQDEDIRAVVRLRLAFLRTRILRGLGIDENPLGA